MKNTDVAPKDHRFKTIIVATIAAALIIAVGVWAIMSAISSVGGGSKVATTNSSESSSVTKTETTTNETKGTDAISPSTNYTVSDNSNVVSTTTDLPTTGPADVIISALGLGMIVTLVLVNVNLVQKQTV